MPNYLGKKGTELVQKIMDAAIKEGVLKSPFKLQEYFENCICEGYLIPTECKFITKEGGGEGGTEDCFSVFVWKDVFYRTDYKYYSYVGYEFYDMEKIYEVTPVVRPKTYYEQMENTCQII